MLLYFNKNFYYYYIRNQKRKEKKLDNKVFSFVWLKK